MAGTALSNLTDAGTVASGDKTYVVRGGNSRQIDLYEAIQDAAAAMLSDAGDIDFTYTDATPTVIGEIKSDTVGPTELIDTAVTAGTYTNSTITVDAQGRLTSAATGTTNNPLGQCRLVYVGTTSIRLDRRNGSYLSINGANEQIPSAGVTMSNATLSASTKYYIYAFMSSGTMTLEPSTTAPAASSTDGTQIKTGDATRALVGRVISNGSSEFIGGNYSNPNGVVSWFNPERLFRVEQVLIGPAPGTGFDVADTSSAYAFMTGTTANSIADWLFVGTSRIKFARWRAIWGTNNTGNKVRLVHFDDGPANITQIDEFVSDGTGNPENDAVNVTTTLQALQDGILDKSIAIQVLCVNGTVYTIYKMALEITYDLDAF